MFARLETLLQLLEQQTGLRFYLTPDLRFDWLVSSSDEVRLPVYFFLDSIPFR